jgi:hypothetical protein
MSNSTMTFMPVNEATEIPSGELAASKEISDQTVLEAKWATEWPHLAGFFPQGGTTGVAGINLVYMAGQDTAEVGDLITFTAWILNATSQVITDVSLHLRSFTNELGDQLKYRTEPQVTEMAERTLAPQEVLKYYFSYEVTKRDVEEPGLLISALQAELESPSKGTLFSECDALVSVAPPNANQHSSEDDHQN